MATIKPAYAAAAAITITITSLGNGSARASTVVDNSSNLYDDALVSLTVKGGTVVAPSTVEVWAYSLGDGPAYTDAVTGTDAAYTMVSPSNLRLIGIINVPGNATSYVSPEFSVAEGFGGNLPQKWGIVTVNKTGASLDASVGSASYIGVQYTIA